MSASQSKPTLLFAFMNDNNWHKTEVNHNNGTIVLSAYIKDSETKAYGGLFKAIWVDYYAHPAGTSSTTARLKMACS